MKARRATRSIRSRPSNSPSGARPPSRCENEWADNVRKAGHDPQVLMKELKDILAKYNSLY